MVRWFNRHVMVTVVRPEDRIHSKVEGSHRPEKKDVYLITKAREVKKASQQKTHLFR